MSILNGNDTPDFSTAVNASGNLVDATTVASAGSSYVGPKIYVAGAPSLFLVGTATVGSTTTLLVQVNVYASATAVVPVAAFPFTLGPGANSLNLLVPVVGPYVQLEVLSVSATNAWSLGVYQSATTVSVPTSVRRGYLTESAGTSIGVGLATFPFAFVVPGDAGMNIFVPSTTAFANIVDATNGAVIWSSGVFTAGDENTNAEFILPPNQCELKIDNGGATAITCNWTVLC